MPLWRGGPNTRTLPTVLTPSASTAADMAHLCVPQNQALGVCRGFAPDIQICGTRGRKNLVNATIISNAEEEDKGRQRASDLPFVLSFARRVDTPKCAMTSRCFRISSFLFRCVPMAGYSNAIYHTEQQKSLKSYSKNAIGVKKASQKKKEKKKKKKERPFCSYRQ